MSATDRDVESLVRRHVDALMRGDVPAVMDDYADDAVLIGTFGVLAGREAIGAAFAGAGEMIRGLVIDHVTGIGDTTLLVFHTDALAFAVDTFVLRDGRIVTQTTASRPG